MCHSSPNIPHTDQMTLIVRCVTIKNSIAQVKESFLNFFPLSGKRQLNISPPIVDELDVNNLNVMMCRAQGSHNASTMSGIHAEVQQTIKNINPKALLVPSRNDTPNLAGVHAVGLSQLSDRFFAVLERLHAFFCCLSSKGWDVLLNNLKRALSALKQVIDTRLSVHHAAVKAFTQVLME